MKKDMKNNYGRGFLFLFLHSYVKCMPAQTRAPHSDTEKHLYVNELELSKGSSVESQIFSATLKIHEKNQLQNSLCWEEETEHVLC